MIKLFIIDKQPTFITGLTAIFEETACNITVVGSATSCKKALEFLKNNKVHLLLIDPSTIESLNNNCIEMIKKTYHEINIIVLTNDLDINYLNNLWKAGVDGIELKNCGKKALLNLLNQVLEGNRVVGNKIPHFIYKTERKIDLKLSFKEKEIYQLMLSVNSYEEIAGKLKLPLIAVKFDCKNILKKVSKNKNTNNLNNVSKNLLVS
jgi:two-component system response regulator FimZ (fimbrial Z protein)